MREKVVRGGRVSGVVLVRIGDGGSELGAILYRLDQIGILVPR